VRWKIELGDNEPSLIRLCPASYIFAGAIVIVSVLNHVRQVCCTDVGLTKLLCRCVSKL
jgi:hypothetical protein